MSRLHDFEDFKPGDSVEIDFDAFEIDGVQIVPRTRMRGVLLDPVLATLRIETASPELDIDLPEIGLGVIKEKERPNPDLPLPTLQHVVAEGGTFSFFDPEDVDPEKIYARVPYDKFKHRLARYGHVAVNGALLF